MSSAIGDRPLMSAFLCRSAMCSMYPSGLPVDAGKSETAAGCGQRVPAEADRGIGGCMRERGRARNMGSPGLWRWKSPTGGW